MNFDVIYKKPKAKINHSPFILEIQNYIFPLIKM